MRVRLRTNYPARSSDRIVDGLRAFLPAGVKLVNEDADADLVLIHVGGRPNHVERHIESLRAAGKRYAILQLVLRACDRPHTAGWTAMWRDATVVWSYYDLAAEMRADGVDPTGINLLYTPLGVEEALWRPTPGLRRNFDILATGDNVRRDSLRDIYRACRRARARMVHVGPPLVFGSHLTHMSNISDADMAAWYSQCEYVSGLRTIEGFELCAVEGLLCGARPLLFDRPNHRLHFGSLAEYIPVPPPNTSLLADWLTEWLCEPARPVTAVERDEAVARFDWRPIAAQFWDKVL